MGDKKIKTENFKTLIIEGITPNDGFSENYILNIDIKNIVGKPEIMIGGEIKESDRENKFDIFINPLGLLKINIHNGSKKISNKSFIASIKYK